MVDTDIKIKINEDPTQLPNIRIKDTNRNRHKMRRDVIVRDNVHWLKVYVSLIIKLVISIIAGILVWRCNGNHNVIVRIFFTLLAMTFSEFYILYYAIYHVFMGNVCPSGIVSAPIQAPYF